MKKMLNLLNILIISGIAIPITNAASIYQKEEEIKLENNEINKTKFVICANGVIIFSYFFVLRNKLYFGLWDNNIYEYNSNYYNLEKNNNFYLKQISNNYDTTILNKLNYLNLDLDILQLEIVNKTNTLFIIKSKDNKYFIKITFNYKIKNSDEINNINLNELIKRYLFFKFHYENFNLKFKEIKKY